MKHTSNKSSFLLALDEQTQLDLFHLLNYIDLLKGILNPSLNIARLDTFVYKACHDYIVTDYCMGWFVCCFVKNACIKPFPDFNKIHQLTEDAYIEAFLSNHLL